MIRAIRIDDQVIDLVPAVVVENPELNLFAADSMTLVVGPNGSGKTRLLVRLAEEVIAGDPMNIESTGPLSNYDVIYLTLSNFGKPPFKRRSKRLHVLYRPRATAGLPSDAEVVAGLRSFGWKPRHQVRIAGSWRAGAKFVVDYAVKAYQAEQVRPGKLLDALTALDEIQLLLRRTDVSESGERWFGSEGFRRKAAVTERIEALMTEHLIRESRIFDELGYRDLPSYRLVFRAVAIASRSRDADIDVNAVLSSSPYLRRASRERSRNHDVDRSLHYITETMSMLSYVGSVVGDDGLSRDVFPIRGQQVRGLRDQALARVCTVELNAPSSGMAALVTQFTEIKRVVERRVIHGQPQSPGLVILIDEGDVFLHLEWQQRYIEFLDRFASQLKTQFTSVQVIVATHSPVLMSDFPRDCVVRLPLIAERMEDAPADPVTVSFGAQLSDIVKNTGGAGTMGEFAVKTIKRWAEMAREGRRIHPYHLSLIDDPVLRRLLLTEGKRVGE
jgi:energy-coupling factor transporter ATP-binding protein EcfA2